MTAHSFAISAHNAPIYQLDNFGDLLKASRDTFIANSSVVNRCIEYIEKELLPKLARANASWQDFTVFWPPRCVEALRRGEAVVFFGAGLSVDSGIPSWGDLLGKHFGLDQSLIEDEELARDPLTLAELASHYLGNERLQEILRAVMDVPPKVSVNHLALAALRCPFYITTNYDRLFELAWEKANPGIDLVVATNESDLAKEAFTSSGERAISILFKIHGCVSRLDEHMILTRRDYRYHYRRNNKLFERIRELMRSKHTIFLGFSHRDPEVSRLVEDAIYHFEQGRDDKAAQANKPNFYSLQFDMRAHTPEVFAARGIVALTPPPDIRAPLDSVKTTSLAIALIDLLGAKQYNLHKAVALDIILQQATEAIGEPIARQLEKIGKYSQQAEKSLGSADSEYEWLRELRNDLGEFASQGVFLLNDQGNVVAFDVPPGLDKEARRPTRALNKRPYFKQAKSFRAPFVSDTVESIYNRHSTFFFCVPLLRRDQMIGLLFSACQVGQWGLPIEIAKNLWSERKSFLLIDSNGVCILPPQNEFQVFDSSHSNKEQAGLNNGYPYQMLLGLSRRDALVRHISKSVIPVAQDDDVLILSGDYKQFTIVGEVPRTRWKIAVSVPVSGY